MEIIDYDESPKNKNDPEIIKSCFIQINNELELRHQFGLYDPFINYYDLGYKWIDKNNNKFKVILK